eukprot:m.15254 g.15254  ORF g.15254 m.15254 type:complete len:162 (-) comp24755_c0_seq1:882-1367(-)
MNPKIARNLRCQKRFAHRSPAIAISAISAAKASHARARSFRPLTFLICNPFRQPESPLQLDRHNVRHTGAKPSECFMCHERFSQRASMLRHFSRMHPGMHPPRLRGSSKRRPSATSAPESQEEGDLPGPRKSRTSSVPEEDEEDEDEDDLFDDDVFQQEDP